MTERDAPSRHRLGQRSYSVAQLPPGGRHTLKSKSWVFRLRKAVPFEMTVPVVAAHQLRSYHAICRLHLRHGRHLPVVVAQDRVFSDGVPSQWPGFVPAKTGLMSTYTRYSAMRPFIRRKTLQQGTLTGTPSNRV